MPPKPITIRGLSNLVDQAAENTKILNFYRERTVEPLYGEDNFKTEEKHPGVTMLTYRDKGQIIHKLVFDVINKTVNRVIINVQTAHYTSSLFSSEELKFFDKLDYKLTVHHSEVMGQYIEDWLSEE